MRLYRMELYKLYHNKIFRIGLFAATALLLAYFWFAEVGGEIAQWMEAFIPVMRL